MLPEGTEDLIARAFREDLGDGDHTTLSTIPADAVGTARLLVKQQGVLAGVDLAAAIAHHFDPKLEMTTFLKDGSLVQPGDVAFLLDGSSRSILMVERLLLNFMQRMSGIATLTHQFVSALEGTGCKVLDTRKTTPGMRAMEKWAVRIGGGHNHRMGLYDMVMIKDNHADLAGGISKAIAAVHQYQREHALDLPVVVEVRNMSELDEVLKATGPVDRVLLDNFTRDALLDAVAHVGGRIPLEASGGITLENARVIASTGVDYISVGALTHSAGSLDLSLKAH